MAAIKPFKPLDEKFPFDRQLGVAVAPLVLINLFAVLDPADEAGFLDAFKAAAEVITKQPASFPCNYIGRSAIVRLT